MNETLKKMKIERNQIHNCCSHH